MAAALSEILTTLIISEFKARIIIPQDVALCMGITHILSS